MKKGIILYQSKYGATKTYVDWISNKTGYPIMQTKQASLDDVKDKDIIILAGGIYASGIAGLSFIKKNIKHLHQKIAVVCVGASPYNQDAFQQVYEHNFKDQLQGITCFYARGAWNEKDMTFKDRTLCKLLQKAISKKDPNTYEPWEQALAQAIGKECNWTSEDYLKPLYQWLDE